MLHDIILLFCISVCGATSTSSPHTLTTTTTKATKATTTTVAAYLYVQAVVSPEYPVAAGLTVKLHCSVETNMPQVSWNWVYLTKTGWQNVGNTMDLSLTEPNQTGTYCCYASATGIKQKSSNTVTAYIVAMQPTGENLGIAAIILACLALIVAITVLIMWALQKYGGAMTTTNTTLKGFPGPGPGKIPKGDFPQTGNDGEVYMNYTTSSQAYTNLDPTSMTADNVYSSLS